MNELDWLTQLLAAPPERVSQLEALVGKLFIEFGSGEGMGHVVRPWSGRRDELRPEIRNLVLETLYDRKTDDAKQPRDMAITGLTLGLALTGFEVKPLLVEQFGTGRFVHDDRSALQTVYGPWFFHAREQTSALRWYRSPPTWSRPPDPPEKREAFLRTVVDRVTSESDRHRLVAALTSAAAAANARVFDDKRRITIEWSPPLGVALLARTLAWEHPVAYSDTYMQTWWVAPKDHGTQPLRLGRWTLRARLVEWPHGPNHAELPKIDRLGASPTFDLKTTVTPIAAIELE